jgi:hypothetical protein
MHTHISGQKMSVVARQDAHLPNIICSSYFVVYFVLLLQDYCQIVGEKGKLLQT